MKIKVLTLNLFFPGSNKLFLKALDFLKKEQADIMFLQETCDSGNTGLPEKFRKRAEIKKIFPEYFDVYMPVFTDTRKIEGEINDGQLILSKFALSQKKSVFIDLPYGKYDHDSMNDFSNFPAGFLSCFASIDGKKVKLINLHGSVNYNGSENDKRRMKLLDLLKKEIQKDEFVILAGDSNARPETQLISQLELKLQNSFSARGRSAFGGKNKLTTTFNLRRKNLQKHPGFAQAVVDIMLISKNIKVLESSQPQVDVSDHLPLVAKLEF